MNGALRQYVEVLKINPDNEKAITEIEQIWESTLLFQIAHLTLIL